MSSCHKSYNEIPILFTKSLNSLKETTYYSIYLSNDNEISWDPLIINSTWLTHYMNLDNIKTGEYSLKIIARSESGLVKEQITDPFWLWNGSAMLIEPQFVLPINGSSFTTNDEINLTWNKVFLIYNPSTVYYSIYIRNSTNSILKIKDCILIESQIKELNYIWSLSDMKEGNYQVIILAECKGYELANYPYLTIKIEKDSIKKNIGNSSILIVFIPIALLRLIKKKKG